MPEGTVLHVAALYFSGICWRERQYRQYYLYVYHTSFDPLDNVSYSFRRCK